MALTPHLLDLPIQVADPLADAPALGLDLLLARPTARADATTHAAHLAVVRVGADQARQQVMQSRRLDLQAAFMRARMKREDLEDDIGAIEHANLERALEIALLPRAQVLIADEHVERALEHQLTQGVDLARAYEMRWLDLGSALHVPSNNFSAGRSRELGELCHLLTHQVLGCAR